MVLSTTKKTSSVASIANQSTNGGNKKAGLPSSVGLSTAGTVALRKVAKSMAVLALPVSSTTCSSRPIGSLPGNWPKC
jgi:hypothetical protein